MGQGPESHGTCRISPHPGNNPLDPTLLLCTATWFYTTKMQRTLNHQTTVLSPTAPSPEVGASEPPSHCSWSRGRGFLATIPPAAPSPEERAFGPHSVPLLLAQRKDFRATITPTTPDPERLSLRGQSFDELPNLSENITLDPRCGCLSNLERGDLRMRKRGMEEPPKGERSHCREARPPTFPPGKSPPKPQDLGCFAALREKMPFHHVTAGLLYKGNYLNRSLSAGSDSEQLANISVEELDVISVTSHKGLRKPDLLGIGQEVKTAKRTAEDGFPFPCPFGLHACFSAQSRVPGEARRFQKQQCCGQAQAGQGPGGLRGGWNPQISWPAAAQRWADRRRSWKQAEEPLLVTTEQLFLLCWTDDDDKQYKWDVHSYAVRCVPSTCGLSTFRQQNHGSEKNPGFMNSFHCYFFFYTLLLCSKCARLKLYALDMPVHVRVVMSSTTLKDGGESSTGPSKVGIQCYSQGTTDFLFGKMMAGQEIREAFRVLDRDGNGFISKQELGMAMRSLGYMPSEVELAIIMQRLDMDGDGQVDFDEFMTILGPKLVSSEGRDGFLGNTIDSIFWQFDMQRITLEELKHILYHAFRDHLTMKDIENIIINEEESLNETSGNCQTEFEGVHSQKQNRQTCVRKSLICAFAMAFIISVMLIAANQILRSGME
ncbi:Calcium-binding protein 8 [Heterocephalus glaber]|nr:Calcium-binding protein 8 [Heterocephalus glaber]